MLSKPEEGCEVENSRQKDSTCQDPEAGEHSAHFLCVGREQGGRKEWHEAKEQRTDQAGPPGQAIHEI